MRRSKPPTSLGSKPSMNNCPLRARNVNATYIDLIVNVRDQSLSMMMLLVSDAKREVAREWLNERLIMLL